MVHLALLTIKDQNSPAAGFVCAHRTLVCRVGGGGKKREGKKEKAA